MGGFVSPTQTVAEGSLKAKSSREVLFIITGSKLEAKPHNGATVLVPCDLNCTKISTPQQLALSVKLWKCLVFWLV